LTKNKNSLLINYAQIFGDTKKYCTAQKNDPKADPRQFNLGRRFAREVAQYFHNTAERARASEGLFGYVVTHAPSRLQPYL